jgi:hypothetical protein
MHIKSRDLRRLPLYDRAGRGHSMLHLGELYTGLQRGFRPESLAVPQSHLKQRAKGELLQPPCFARVMNEEYGINWERKHVPPLASGESASWTASPAVWLI